MTAPLAYAPFMLKMRLILPFFTSTNSSPYFYLLQNIVVWPLRVILNYSVPHKHGGGKFNIHSFDISFISGWNLFHGKFCNITVQNLIFFFVVFFYLRFMVSFSHKFQSELFIQIQPNFFLHLNSILRCNNLTIIWFSNYLQRHTRRTMRNYLSSLLLFGQPKEKHCTV